MLLLLLWNVVGLRLVVASCGGSWSVRLVWNQCDHIGLEYRAILLRIFCGYLWIFCGYLGIFWGYWGYLVESFYLNMEKVRVDFEECREILRGLEKS